jgi:hypothetical protein
MHKAFPNREPFRDDFRSATANPHESGHQFRARSVTTMQRGGKGGRRENQQTLRGSPLLDLLESEPAAFAQPPERDDELFLGGD